MAVTKPPAFQFYAKDFLTGTMTMSLAERGAYATLLAYQWDTGGVPADDPMALARAMQCDRSEAEQIWMTLQRKFKRSFDGVWRNIRLEKERRLQRKFRKLQSDKGKKGGRPKSRGLTPVKPKPKPGESSSSSSSSSSVRTPQPPADAGGRVTREERRRAAAAIDRSWTERRRHGPNAPLCPHAPPLCANREACIDREVHEGRRRRAS